MNDDGPWLGGVNNSKLGLVSEVSVSSAVLDGFFLSHSGHLSSQSCGHSGLISEINSKFMTP